MILILMGPEGCGKGTVGAMLESSLGIPLTGTGELLREEIAKGSELGKDAQKFITAGHLVPDALITDILTKKLDLLRKGYILDGFPRRLSQLKSLDAYFKKHNKEIDGVFFLDVPEQVSLERITTRLICTNCKKIYNTKSNPPLVTGICDKCNKALAQRIDDQTKDAFHRRHEQFAQETLPVIQEFERRKILIKIDATKKPTEIVAEILKSYSVPG